MSGFLLDTNCISEVVRSKPEPRVLEWRFARVWHGYRRANGGRI